MQEIRTLQEHNLTIETYETFIKQLSRLEEELEKEPLNYITKSLLQDLIKHYKIRRDFLEYSASNIIADMEKSANRQEGD